MPTYFFHSQGGARFTDEIGTELPDDANALHEAVRLTGAMMNQEPQLLLANRLYKTDVVSAAGETLFTILAEAMPGGSA